MVLEKAIIIYIFMLSLSFAALGVQFIAADTFGITITNFEGTPIRSNILDIVDIDQINLLSSNIVEANFTGNTTITGDYNRVEVPEVAAAYVAWELITLITGTYIFNVLLLLGVPSIIIVGMVIIYVLLLGRAIFGYIRGI